MKRFIIETFKALIFMVTGAVALSALMMGSEEVHQDYLRIRRGDQEE